MRKMIRPAVVAAAGCVVLTACAQPPTPLRALPLGPTPEEIADYARAQAQYRTAQASGNDDIAVQAVRTFLGISEEILSRQDPRLFEARIVCERYRLSGPPDPRAVRSTFEPQFVQDCKRIDWQYDRATIAIRRDLEAKIAAADLATVAQAGAGHP
jgi:hypothetical protein